MAQHEIAYENKMKHHERLKWALVALVVLHWSAWVSAQPTKVAIGYSGISADQLVIWVAKDAGIFAKNNIDAQTVYFSGGTPIGYRNGIGRHAGHSGLRTGDRQCRPRRRRAGLHRRRHYDPGLLADDPTRNQNS